MLIFGPTLASRPPNPQNPRVIFIFYNFMASGECALVEPGFLRAAARFYYTAIHRESKKFHFRRVAFFVTPLPSYDDEATTLIPTQRKGRQLVALP